MKIFFKIIIALLLAYSINGCQQNNTTKTKVGIILPLEHKALEEIVAGFSEKLQQLSPNTIQIKVMNAQGDANLQRAIIQQMRDQHYHLIIPVATGVTQMTASMIHNTPIVSLAANLTEKDRQKLKPCNITAVHDEIPPQQLIEFIHAAYPHLKHLTLIHSTSDKIFPEIEAAILAGKKYGIEIKPLMAATLPDLVSISQALPANTQGIFILKDNLIASGIGTLVNASRLQHIPLFASDQGSVESGAGIALGVHERQIGEEGANLAVEILHGKPACTLPIVEMKNLTVFLNKKTLEQTAQSIAPIQAAASNFQYPVEFIERK